MSAGTCRRMRSTRSPTCGPGGGRWGGGAKVGGGGGSPVPRVRRWGRSAVGWREPPALIPSQKGQERDQTKIELLIFKKLRPLEPFCLSVISKNHYVMILSGSQEFGRNRRRPGSKHVDLPPTRGCEVKTWLGRLSTEHRSGQEDQKKPASLECFQEVLDHGCAPPRGRGARGTCILYSTGSQVRLRCWWGRAPRGRDPEATASAPRNRGSRRSGQRGPNCVSGAINEPLPNPWGTGERERESRAGGEVDADGLRRRELPQVRPRRRSDPGGGG